ncbi:hypothetical protein R3P38DRAFT_3212006 [Favolaschia claudopus]|uniref:Uncharacterized protein n=1 Tax=Favolaschia claudopus TaxID=2862362 RepID=A0AAW0AF49_9AGAR
MSNAYSPHSGASTDEQAHFTVSSTRTTQQQPAPKCHRHPSYRPVRPAPPMLPTRTQPKEAHAAARGNAKDEPPRSNPRRWKGELLHHMLEPAMHRAKVVKRRQDGYKKGESVVDGRPQLVCDQEDQPWRIARRGYPGASEAEYDGRWGTTPYPKRLRDRLDGHPRLGIYERRRPTPPSQAPSNPRFPSPFSLIRTAPHARKSSPPQPPLGLTALCAADRSLDALGASPGLHDLSTHYSHNEESPGNGGDRCKRSSSALFVDAAPSAGPHPSRPQRASAPKQRTQ